MKKRLIFAALGAVALSSSAALADWHKAYIHREQNGDWMSYQYDDGFCYYSYERSGFDQRPYTYSSGDCSHVSFQPEGNTIYALPDDAD